MKLPIIREPTDWKARDHLGTNLKGFSPIERQIIGHFDILLQRFEWIKTCVLWALNLAIWNFVLLAAILVAVLIKSPEVVSMLLKSLLE